MTEHSLECDSHANDAIFHLFAANISIISFKALIELLLVMDEFVAREEESNDSSYDKELNRKALVGGLLDAAYQKTWAGVFSSVFSSEDSYDEKQLAKILGDIKLSVSEYCLAIPQEEKE